MNVIVATSELTCLFFLIVILSGEIINYKKGDFIVKSFIGALISTGFFTLIDSISWLTEFQSNLNILNYITSAISYFGTTVTCFFFALFAKGFISRKAKISNLILYIVGSLSAISVLFISITASTGVLFEVEENGNFIPGNLVYVASVINIISVIVISVFIIKNAKLFSKKELVGFASFFAFPLIAVTVEGFMPEASFVYPAICVSMMVIDLHIELQVINEANIKQQVMEEVLNQDTLTGLPNRRAFEAKMKEVNSSESYAIFFADLNKLKTTNDTLGHDAGDILIIQFANLMAETFGSDKVFRISGDEFVVIEKSSKDEFNSQLEAFRKVIVSQSDIACCGGCYGEGLNPYYAFNLAEKNLNEEKTNFYKRIGLERRK